ncbi:MAG: YggS family pyridoxal phosphate-dependent enzyme [Chloroflexi bacterium]|nr:YggS family pyridoxal phosphate-dependent enzyme [Chloroflexota bacterium]
MPDLVSTIRERYLHVLDNISVAADKVGRNPESIRLVVVTKTQPIEVVQAAIEAGAKTLGENYAEEAVEKILALESQSAVNQYAVEWHMIGHVQSRRAQLVAEHFALFHSLDSLKLAQRVDRFAGEVGRTLPVLLEFNVGGEESKSGWLASDEARWPDLLSDVNAIAALTNLEIRGLMTMPPLTIRSIAARAYFQRLRRLRDFLVERVPQTSWTELSMGTSSDYSIAVEEGATLVRIGQAILGPRP